MGSLNFAGYFSAPTGIGRYKMGAEWIDTDNECWAEPAAAGVGDIRANGIGHMLPNPHVMVKHGF